MNNIKMLYHDIIFLSKGIHGNKPSEPKEYDIVTNCIF